MRKRLWIGLGGLMLASAIGAAAAAQAPSNAGAGAATPSAPPAAPASTPPSTPASASPASAPPASAPPAAAPGNAEHGRQVSLACAACHGPTGDSANPQYPKLAGQQAGYLAAQMQAYRSGARVSPVMTSLLTPMSDADLADVAAWYASQTPTPAPATDAGLVATGERLFATAPAGGRACAACHGPGAAGHGAAPSGRPGAVPRLAAQNPAYTVAQLDAFASGARTSPAMSRIASALSPSDRQALAAYLATLP
jgi:cytochrome c553